MNTSNQAPTDPSQPNQIPTATPHHAIWYWPHRLHQFQQNLKKKISPHYSPHTLRVEHDIRKAEIRFMMPKVSKYLPLLSFLGDMLFVPSSLSDLSSTEWSPNKRYYGFKNLLDQYISCRLYTFYVSSSSIKAPPPPSVKDLETALIQRDKKFFGTSFVIDISEDMQDRVIASNPKYKTTLADSPRRPPQLILPALLPVLDTEPVISRIATYLQEVCDVLSAASL